MSKVGLFFGSFNPIHNGHVSIAEYVRDHSDLNEVWLVVSPQSPFKGIDHLLPFEHRFNMVKLALNGVERISATDIEKELPTPSYTVNTLSELKLRYPQHNFVLVMGGDNLTSFQDWKDYQTILDSHGILCYSRSGAERCKFSDHPNVTMLSAALLPESSTYIRRRLSVGEDIGDKVHPDVLEYLMRYRLFE